MSANRRNFILGTVAAAANAGVAAALSNANAVKDSKPTAPRPRPNIIVYHSDQFRWDFIGANGLNSSTHTPNLDALARRATNFTRAVTNQPVCAPSRAVMLTSRYATETGVWENGPGLGSSLPTLATELRKTGYTANYIGKWHLARQRDPAGGGPKIDYQAVKPEDRGGFLDLWEAANVLEFTSHPNEGSIWDGDGIEIAFKDQYRVDFLTDRAERFLRQKHEKPFLLFISQLEPHAQNDLGHSVGPKGSEQRFVNPFVPPDIRALPGIWQEQLPGYYACIEAIDASVGRIRGILEEEKLADNTIFVFLSDHGCHFETRNELDKRSPHNSSLRIPLLISGPGFGKQERIEELVGIIHLTPTLLEAAGVLIPSTMKGKSLLPLINDIDARVAWPNKEFIQISESFTGRAICTKDWTYCIADPSDAAPSSISYREYQLYDQRADPLELINLAGRREYRETAKELREELIKLMVSAGEPEPKIAPAELYP